MNTNATLGLILCLLGLFSTLFRKQIVKFIGPSKDGDYSIEVRENKILIGGILSMIGGIFAFLKFFEGF